LSGYFKKLFDFCTGISSDFVDTKDRCTSFSINAILHFIYFIVGIGKANLQISAFDLKLFLPGCFCVGTFSVAANCFIKFLVLTINALF